VVDVHCHPFLNPGPYTPDEFVNAIAFSGGGLDFMREGGVPDGPDLHGEIQNVRRNTLWVRYAVRQLAALLDCAPTVEAVAAARNEAMAGDYTAYAHQLYAAAGITALVADMGYPQPPVDLDAFRTQLPAEIVPLLRIEPLIVDLLAAPIGWDEFRRRYDETIADALGSGGYRGLKSIIAYRTGLDVSPLSRTPDQGLQALDAIRRGTGGEAMKKLRDHLLCRALELCMEYDVPMQIHSGMGDWQVNLVKCRPGLLMDLLRFPTFRACNVIIVHTGYPYHAEAGYMANMLPRVYCDVSEGIPFASNAAKRIFLETMEMAPISKVVFGTDGYTLPEINFAGTMLGKQALGEALDELVAASFLDEGEAYEAAGWILAGTARRLYKMDA
jgi:hypothetical protein